ncbi:MAG: PhoH-like protein [Phycisphaerae bacterium]|nr:PhoH-like protein [Phycisphaerae bacterium]
MELSISLHAPHRRVELFGPGDVHLRRIREALKVEIQSRSAVVKLQGEPANVARAAAVIEKLQGLLKSREAIDADTVSDALHEADGQDESARRDAVSVFTSGAAVSAKTPGQQAYLDAMRRQPLVICVGPAGTGKTYLAVAMAVHLLKTSRTRRIVLVRPAVEAGEKLGFLPGDMQQKVNPYLRPMFDALHDMMTYDQLKRFMVSDVIEVVPLAFMRGRTLNHAVIILDEAQNSTPSQMFMFLTRLGNDSKMIVTGDDTQVDLEPGQPSGLTDAIERLRGCDGVTTIRLEDVDIVRHPLVQRIVNRYGTLNPRRPSSPSSAGQPPTDSL